MKTDSNLLPRSLKITSLSCDLTVIGGGISGVCAAITAARAGLKVVLIQDRPVLGGNASSEVRLWILGATSHMGNNNRWAREGGVMEQQEQTALDFLLRVVKAEVTAVLVDLMEVVVLEAVQSVLFTPGQLVNSHQLV